MRIAVLVPMVTELKPLVREGGLVARKPGDGDVTVHESRVGAADVVAAIAGIGTSPARRATARLLDRLAAAHTAADHVVVCGIAGGFAGVSTVGGLVVPASVMDRATGARYRATQLGPIEPSGSLVTSGELITDAQVLTALAAEGHLAIDMETAAVAAVCEERGLPWTAFRGISDIAGDGLDDAVLGLVNADGSYRLGAAVRFALTRPQRIPELVKLGRGLDKAAGAAARATVTACRAV